jgi:hypothetical protein
VFENVIVWLSIGNKMVLNARLVLSFDVLRGVP